MVRRYSKNPVIGRYDTAVSNSIFNSAVVTFGDGYAGVFRCDNKAVRMNIYAKLLLRRHKLENLGHAHRVRAGQHSDDTLRLQVRSPASPGLKTAGGSRTVQRVRRPHDAASATRSTSSVSTNARTPSSPSTATACFFPQKIGGRYAVMSRPSDNGHTPFGDIFISYSPDT